MYSLYPDNNETITSYVARIIVLAKERNEAVGQWFNSVMLVAEPTSDPEILIAYYRVEQAKADDLRKQLEIGPPKPFVWKGMPIGF